MRSPNDQLLNYQKAIQAIADRRLQWQTNTKHLVLRIFNEINEKTGNFFRVEEDFNTENLENISLVIPATRSGITKKENDRKVSIIQGSSFLACTQNYYGYVMFVIYYPFIEGLADERVERKTELLFKENPIMIDVDTIYEAYESFMFKMTQWAEGEGLDIIEM